MAAAVLRRLLECQNLQIVKLRDSAVLMLRHVRVDARSLLMVCMHIYIGCRGRAQQVDVQPCVLLPLRNGGTCIAEPQHGKLVLAHTF
jgi:hypothetical protein